MAHNYEDAEDLQLDNLTKISDNKHEHNHSDDDGYDHDHNHSDDDEDHDHDHGSEGLAGWKSRWDLLLALLILIVMIVLKFGFHFTPTKWIDLTIHAIAFFLAGWRVLDLAFRKAKRGDIFNEFVLMSVATLGAFYIGSYNEGVAVMVFYCIGECFRMQP